MLIKRLRVENFGPFMGEHCLDLMPSPLAERKPIVLVGGENGSGKTSLLEAVKWCIHGSNATRQALAKDYHSYLVGRIHHPQMGNEPERLAVCLEIEHAEAGINRTYDIVRTFTNINGRALESLELFREGKRLEELYPDQYQSFLNELVPPGLAELFFFDGERIQRLAQADEADPELVDSIMALLGLDLTRKLQADLATVLRNRKGSPRTSELQAAIIRAQDQLEPLTQSSNSLEREIEESEATISQIEQLVQSQEQKIASEGGEFAKRRDDLLQNQARWKQTIDSQESELRNLVNGLLPFCLVPELCQQLKDRVEFEANLRRHQATRELIESGTEQVLETFEQEAFWNNTVGNDLLPESRQRLVEAVADLMVRAFPRPATSSVESVHDLTENDRHKLIAEVDSILNAIPEQIRELSSEIESGYQSLHRVQQDLQRAPQDELIRPLLEELRSLQRRLAETRAVHKAQQEQLKAVNRDRDELTKKIANLEGQQLDAMTESRKKALATKVNHVLRAFEEDLSVARVERLGQLITEYFQRLTHKESICSRITVDPHSFATSLLDVVGNPIAKFQLSAGEKQVFAISVLWALGKSSGRNLPIIVDTPLARLDAKHRHNLLTEYFPNAGHQVIIFSTDTEIDRDAYQLLEQNVAQVYRLQSSPEFGSSTISSGYFEAALR